MMIPVIVRRAGRLMVASAMLLGATSCATDVTRTGNAPAYLIIDSITAASGATPGTFGSQLNSDVQTLIDQTVNGVKVRVATVYNDLGKATMRMALKNAGSTTTPTTPSTVNEITLTRYHVNFTRSDGRNTPGVDVPYGFDGGVTQTVSSTTPATIGFDIVRHTNKEESPLRNLVNAGGAIQISTIAEITFYGHDQAGNEVTVTGLITVNFADFGDPS